ncbi:rRNA maturation RNase YbeY [bacterium]|nr:MAG: rRNA maturation RNase YbeY [bacterium]
MSIQIFASQKKHSIPTIKIKKLIRLISRAENGKLPNSLSIVFLSNAAMRRINKRFLKHDYATDVISFNLSSERSLEGEIYIGLDKAVTQAREFNVPLSNEILRLAAHGFLHILGHTDDTIRKKNKMLKLGDFYILQLK